MPSRDNGAALAIVPDERSWGRWRRRHGHRSITLPRILWLDCIWTWRCDRWWRTWWAGRTGPSRVSVGVKIIIRPSPSMSTLPRRRQHYPRSSVLPNEVLDMFRKVLEKGLWRFPEGGRAITSLYLPCQGSLNEVSGPIYLGISENAFFCPVLRLLYLIEKAFTIIPVLAYEIP